MTPPFTLIIGQTITASIYKRPSFTAKITGFGTNKGRTVIDLDNNRFIYPSQIQSTIEA